MNRSVKGKLLAWVGLCLAWTACQVYATNVERMAGVVPQLVTSVTTAVGFYYASVDVQGGGGSIEMLKSVADPKHVRFALTFPHSGRRVWVWVTNEHQLLRRPKSCFYVMQVTNLQGTVVSYFETGNIYPHREDDATHPAKFTRNTNSFPLVNTATYEERSNTLQLDFDDGDVMFRVIIGTNLYREVIYLELNLMNPLSYGLLSAASLISSGNDAITSVSQSVKSAVRVDSVDKSATSPKQTTEYPVYANPMFDMDSSAKTLALVSPYGAPAGYTPPDCLDMLDEQSLSLRELEFLEDIDKLLFSVYQPDPSDDCMWFRCVGRRPSGVSGFSSNSIKSVFSTVPGQEKAVYFQIADLAMKTVSNENPVSFDLLRFHLLLVAHLNRVMVEEGYRRHWGTIHRNLLEVHKMNSSHQTHFLDTLVKEMNMVWPLLKNASMKYSVSLFISNVLDCACVGLALEVDGASNRSSILQTIFAYRRTLMSLSYNANALFDIDTDVGSVFSDILGNVIIDKKLHVVGKEMVNKVSLSMLGIQKRLERLADHYGREN